MFCKVSLSFNTFWPVSKQFNRRITPYLFVSSRFSTGRSLSNQRRLIAPHISHPNANKPIKNHPITETALLSYKNIQHSMKFLSFFSQYAAPLYEFTEVQFMKDFFPVILSVQSLVYEADSEIEQGQKDPDKFRGVQPWVDQKIALMKLLKELGLYSTEIEKEADNLTEYWRLENQLMNDMDITHDKLLDAIRLRPSDVMMLHHICQKIKGISVNFQVWQAIQEIEIIRDIEADLRQYENDIKNNDFNIYRMFIKLHKRDARKLLQDELNNRKFSYQKTVDQLPEPFKGKFQDLIRIYYRERPPVSFPKERL